MNRYYPGKPKPKTHDWKLMTDGLCHLVALKTQKPICSSTATVIDLQTPSPQPIVRCPKCYQSIRN